MRIPFLFRWAIKCQAKGCKERATYTWADGSGWFCDMHMAVVRIQFKMAMEAIRKEEERWENGEYKNKKDDKDLV